MSEFTPTLDFSYAYGRPVCQADFRSELNDFIVEEMLGFLPCGEGEHLYVHIKKRGENTQWIAKKLATFFAVKGMDVGFSGMKDRYAQTSQWFSIYLPGYTETVDWQSFIDASESDIEVLDSGMHRQKLRRGMHSANRFTIRLRKLSDCAEPEKRLQAIAAGGVPNYFGEQRFGREGGNLVLADEWFREGKAIRNRDKRGMIMSAARSYLFNTILSDRVQAKSWTTVLDGDAVQDSASGKVPTAPLWGRGRSATQGEALAIEQASLAICETWTDKLEHLGLNQERRALVLLPEQLSWRFEESDLVVSFVLGPGQYATSLLRELCLLNNLAGQ